MITDPSVRTYLDSFSWQEIEGTDAKWSNDGYGNRVYVRLGPTHDYFLCSLHTQHTPVFRRVLYRMIYQLEQEIISV